MNVAAVLQELRERVQNDAAFREELRQDPEGVLQRETGLSLQELAQRAMELSDDELAAVSGGTQDHGEEREYVRRFQEDQRAIRENVLQRAANRAAAFFGKAFEQYNDAEKQSLHYVWSLIGTPWP